MKSLGGGAAPPQKKKKKKKTYVKKKRGLAYKNRVQGVAWYVLIMSEDEESRRISWEPPASWIRVLSQVLLT